MSQEKFHPARIVFTFLFALHKRLVASIYFRLDSFYSIFFFLKPLTWCLSGCRRAELCSSVQSIVCKSACAEAVHHWHCLWQSNRAKSKQFFVKIQKRFVFYTTIKRWLPQIRFPFAFSIFRVNVTLLCLKAACKKSVKVPFKGVHSHRDPPSRGHHRPGQNAFSIYSYECECLVQYFHFFFLWLSHVCGVILWDFLIHGMTHVR